MRRLLALTLFLLLAVATPALAQVTPQVYPPQLPLTCANGEGIIWNSSTVRFECGAVGGSGAVATDAIFDAAGDLVQGTGANTSARLALGTALQVLQVNAGATAAEWVSLASAAARTVLDDATVDAMVETLFGATSTGTGGAVRATSPVITTPEISGAISFPDDVKQTFNPGSTNAGFNPGSLSGDPSALANGDCWYNSSSDEYKCRINGVSVALGAGGAGAPTDATYITQTANGSLSAEQALGALATGCLGSTTTSGVVAARTLIGTANEIDIATGNCSGNPTFTLSATLDLGGKTSFEVPNAAAPSATVFGQLFGDNNFYAASRGAYIGFDGTAAVQFVTPLASDAPANGDVPVFNTGGTVTWEPAVVITDPAINAIWCWDNTDNLFTACVIGTGLIYTQGTDTLSVDWTSPAITTSITTPSTTFALLNATATTINAFGAATTVNTGAAATQIWNFGGSTTASEFRFLEPSGSGTNYSAFKAVAQGASITYSLPPTVGGANTFLKDVAGDGVLSWSTVAGGGDVSKVGTPVNNQMAVWTGDGTLEGTSDVTYDGTALNLITAKNFQIAGVTILSDAAGTTTLDAIDALGTTTETTVEAAIDTLANLTSVQGHTVTLTGAFIRSGAHSLTLTTTGATDVTLPTSGTLYSTEGAVVAVADGGTNCSVASITCFNNITGFTASGTTGTTSTNLVFSTSPTLVTPALGTPASGTLNLSFHMIFLAAPCQNATASVGLNTPTTLGAAGACESTAAASGDVAYGSAVFVTGGANTEVHGHFPLPSDWTGAIDVQVKWRAISTTANNVVFQIKFGCTATGEATTAVSLNNTAFSAVTNLTTTLQWNVSTLTGITTTGCAANEQAMWVLDRDTDTSGDTLDADVQVMLIDFTYRRAVVIGG